MNAAIEHLYEESNHTALDGNLKPQINTNYLGSAIFKLFLNVPERGDGIHSEDLRKQAESLKELIDYSREHYEDYLQAQIDFEEKETEL